MGPLKIVAAADKWGPGFDAVSSKLGWTFSVTE